MRLIGMFDSPYVRRVAISLRSMNLSFEHDPLSVFRDFESFSSINPVVKAPTLIVDNGTTLLDSTLILDFLDRIVSPDLCLMPKELDRFLVSQHLIGFALAACEKSVQIVYETKLRPTGLQYQPWLDRVERQLLAAYDQLEAGYAGADSWLFNERAMQVDITTAVAWRFTRSVLPETVPESRYPALCALSQRAEATTEFSNCPLN